MPVVPEYEEELGVDVRNDGAVRELMRLRLPGEVAVHQFVHSVAAGHCSVLAPSTPMSEVITLRLMWLSRLMTYVCASSISTGEWVAQTTRNCFRSTSSLSILRMRRWLETDSAISGSSSSRTVPSGSLGKLSVNSDSITCPWLAIRRNSSI